jgi:VPDSG-CTERM motif
MKKSFLAVGAVALLCCVFTSHRVQAVPISGTIDFNGAASTNTGDLSTATAFTSFSGVTVSNALPPSGSYSGLGGQAVTTMNGFSFNPPGGVSPLWSFAVGAVTYSFNLATAQAVTQNANFLNVQGIGTAYITGYDPTPGVFAITLTSANGRPATAFSFTAETAVPDGGSAVVLLGIGLTGIEALRRKIGRRKG